MAAAFATPTTLAAEGVDTALFDEAGPWTAIEEEAESTSKRFVQTMGLMGRSLIFGRKSPEVGPSYVPTMDIDIPLPDPSTIDWTSRGKRGGVFKARSREPDQEYMVMGCVFMVVLLAFAAWYFFWPDPNRPQATQRRRYARASSPRRK
jgi:hypothetical protein